MRWLHAQTKQLPQADDLELSLPQHPSTALHLMDNWRGIATALVCHIQLLLQLSHLILQCGIRVRVMHLFFAGEAAHAAYSCCVSAVAVLLPVPLEQADPCCRLLYGELLKL
jgi:hypothetical protein